MLIAVNFMFIPVSLTDIVCSLPMPSVIWTPHFRIDGITSCIIHRLNDLASGFQLPKTNVYKPISFTLVRLCFPPRVSNKHIPFSSLSKRFNAWLGFPISNTSQTSFDTNHGSPSFIIVRTSFIPSVSHAINPTDPFRNTSRLECGPP